MDTLESARESVSSIQSLLKPKETSTARLSNLGIFQAAESSREVLDQVAGTDALRGLISKLGKLSPESLKPLVKVVDQISHVRSGSSIINLSSKLLIDYQIHPYVEGAWAIVSALYKVCKILV